MTYLVNPYRFGVLVYDTFTDSDSTVLSSHTPETDRVGGGWSIWSGTWTIQSNTADQSSTAASPQHAAAIETNNSNVRVTAKVQTASNYPCRVMVRGTDEDNCWVIEIHDGINTFKIRERNGGSFVDRASTSVTVGTGTLHDIVVEASGSTITATFDGGNEISYASATFQQTETKHGMHCYAATGVADSRWDDFKVEEI